MDLHLSGKRALVTGSTKGLGRAIAETLLDEGASVAICARTAEDVDKAVAELSARGTGKVVGASVDAADPQAVRAFVRNTIDQLGGLDVYVHNTSAKRAKTLDAWQTNMNVDLMSLIHAMEEGVDALAADGGGSLISVGTSATAEHFGGGANSYTAFKAAVVNWTLGQAQVLGAKGIRCNVVSPGPIFVEGGDWDRIKTSMPDFFAASEKLHPGGHMGVPQDVADAVAFLASTRAKHITGVTVTVDGGFLKRVDY